jgi:hypothetical protein
MNPTTASAPAALSGVFVNSIASMNNGEVVNDIDDALRQAVRAALTTAKKSRVTIKLEIVPAGEGVGGTPLFKVVDDIEVKLPKKPRSKSPVFFADDDCNLTRRNPKQDEMRLEAIDGGKTPLLKSDIVGTGQAKAASQ